jgi:hypothetical protein
MENKTPPPLEIPDGLAITVDEKWSYNYQVLHLTPEAAETHKAIAMANANAARSQYAVPAEQQTLRAVEETKRFRHGSTAFGIIIMIVLGIATWKLEGASLAWTLTGVTGVAGAVWGYQSRRHEKGQKELSPVD